MLKKYKLSVHTTALITAVVAIMIYLLNVADIFGGVFTFYVFTFLLEFYVIYEIIRLRHFHSMRWLLNPIVLCSLMTFIMDYGLTNLIYMSDKNVLTALKLPEIITVDMNNLLFLAIFAAIAMWIGYWSPLATRLLHGKFCSGYSIKYFKYDVPPKAWAIPTLFYIGILSKLISVWLGIYGYSSSYDNLVKVAVYTQYIALGSSMGRIALLIATIRYSSKNSSLKDHVWFYTTLVTEFIFGILSGFKSAVVIPFIIVIIGQYLRIGKVYLFWFIVVPVAIMLAYSVIEPFRVAKNNNVAFDNTSLVAIMNTMFVAATENTNIAQNDDEIKKQVVISPRTNNDMGVGKFLEFVSRSNLINVGAIGITFHRDNPSIELRPTLNDVLLAPIRAWVPRFLWGSKALSDVGLWYTQTVIGNRNNYSSTAMGIITSAYFIGGFTAIVLIFYIIGIIQRVVFFITQPWVSEAGVIVIVALIPTLSAIPENVFDSTLVTMFRMIPLTIFFQAIIFNHKNPHRKIQ